MKEQVLKLLQEVYGYSAFRGQQEASIEATLAGRDSLVIMPTGGGKSLCYQIPALLNKGVGVIVSPLIALMEDQVSALQQLGIAAAYLNSSMDRNAQFQVIRALEMGQLQLLYVAPERLLMPQTLAFLRQTEIALFAIDEAHCVSQWGHDFRKDYFALGQLKTLFPEVTLIALTATADKRTREDISARLRLSQPSFFIDGFDRPNIRYLVNPRADARRQLTKFLRAYPGKAGIVYCLSRQKVEATAQWLATEGHNALPYHAGLDAATRALHQARFLREDGVIIVATIAFGMGIDKPDVRFVAHLDLPKSIEAYYQETGRAGRDGEPAEAWMVYGLQDVVRLRQMLDSSAMEEEQKLIERHKLNSLLAWCEASGCRRQVLLGYFDEFSPEPCGNCDNCLNPPVLIDATDPARMLLSCIYRTGQRFGAGHVLDVLLGKETAKVRQYGHQHLSTFGIGKAGAEKSDQISIQPDTEWNQQQWQTLLRQLLVQGMVVSDASAFGALRLTAESRPLLRGEQSFMCRKDIQENKPERSDKQKTSITLTGADLTLFEALRLCRKNIATALSLPPYMVFHDSTLKVMAERKPLTKPEMAKISGVGAAKLEKYGDRFITVIAGG